MGSDLNRWLVIPVACALAIFAHAFDVVQVGCGTHHLYRPWLLYLWIATRYTFKLVESFYFWVCDLASDPGSVRHTRTPIAFPIRIPKTWNDGSRAHPITLLYNI